MDNVYAVDKVYILIDDHDGDGHLREVLGVYRNKNIAITKALESAVVKIIEKRLDPEDLEFSTASEGRLTFIYVSDGWNVSYQIMEGELK